MQTTIAQETMTVAIETETEATIEIASENVTGREIETARAATGIETVIESAMIAATTDLRRQAHIIEMAVPTTTTLDNHITVMASALAPAPMDERCSVAVDRHFPEVEDECMATT
jgi:hypothetical protein